jgi:hypothetical protein
VPRRHVVIAGTGRAGTSFLVSFLGACGLQVGDDTGDWGERARAGLEHYLLDPSAPYVVKDPLLFTYCDDIDPEAIAVDALIVPVRDLMDAATSRILQERTALAETSWRERAPVEVRGTVTGGAVYSLDPVDQARILAVGFHRLIYWATSREIPVYFLDFPRLVKDREYLVDCLWPLLSKHCTRDAAARAFDGVADPSQLRFGSESEQDGEQPSAQRYVAPGALGLERDPTRAAELDRTALGILLSEREDDLRSAHASVAALAAQHEEAWRQHEEAWRRLDTTERRRAELEGELQDVRRQHEEDSEAAAHRLQAAQDELHAARDDLNALNHRLAYVQSEYDAMRSTLSWRLTRPVRALRGVFRPGTRAGPPD